MTHLALLWRHPDETLGTESPEGNGLGKVAKCSEMLEEGRLLI